MRSAIFTEHLRSVSARNRALRESPPPKLTPGRMLLTQQAFARGLLAVTSDWFESGRIIGGFTNPYADETPGDVSIHMVGGIRQGLIGIWALASWIHFTARNWRVIWRDDGSLTDAFIEALKGCFPGIERS